MMFIAFRYVIEERPSEFTLMLLKTRRFYTFLPNPPIKSRERVSKRHTLQSFTSYFFFFFSAFSRFFSSFSFSIARRRFRSSSTSI